MMQWFPMKCFSLEIFFSSLRGRRLVLAVALLVGFGIPARAAVLWSHPDAVLVCNTNWDIVGEGVNPRNANSSGTLYFRVLVDPAADTATKWVKQFEAGFLLVEKNKEHLGMGNSFGAMAYSALNVPKAPKGFQDLNSQFPDTPYTYEYMRAGAPRFLVWKIEYVPNQDARVTAWLNPDLSFGATEFGQATNIVVHFEADATFDKFRLMHRGYGAGWTFSRMMVATSFEDLLLPHFWQRRWFFVVTGLGLLLAVAGTVHLMERQRSLRRIRFLEQEHAVEVERARIARDIHDEVGSGLTKISKLADMVGDTRRPADGHREIIRGISEATRETIQTMDEIVWAINPKNDTLKEVASYLVFFAEDFLRPAGIACVLDVPLKLPDAQVSAEVRHNLFMAVKEAFNNAVKHSECSQVKLKLELKNGHQMAIEITDNGKGFDSGQTKSAGNGLENMQRRMKEIGGEFKMQSNSEQGTAVQLQFPLLQPA